MATPNILTYDIDRFLGTKTSAREQEQDIHVMAWNEIHAVSCFMAWGSTTA